MSMSFKQAKIYINELNKTFKIPVPFSNVNLALCTLGNTIINHMKINADSQVRVDVDYETKIIEIFSLNGENISINDIDKNYSFAQFVLNEFKDNGNTVSLKFILYLERPLTQAEEKWLKEKKYINDKMEYTKEAYRYLTDKNFLFFIESGSGDLEGRLTTKYVLGSRNNVMVDCLNYEFDVLKD